MSDILVIGAGIAGLSLALEAEAKGASVIVLSKGNRASGGSSNLAQGGIATVMEASDSIISHINDTLEAGDGLCKKDRVRILAQWGPKTIDKLLQWGVQFSRESDDSFRLALEGGHSHRRILHADDLTGKEIMRALLAQADLSPRIQFVEEAQVLDLITAHVAGEKRCVGARVLLRQNKKSQSFFAKTTVIATGGAGGLWPHTTNPAVATGDGIAIAWRAGAQVEDLEFMQFHPTSLYNPGAKRTFLISEAVRGFGGILKNHDGVEFMDAIHPLRSLAPRDIVARAIHMEMARTGKPHMWLDLTHRKAKDIRTHFPNIYRHCLELGIDMGKDWIPVVPAAHYMCGGIQVDSWSRSTLPGLYACGEAASTGVHGANRLASNSLLESVVFSMRAWMKIQKDLTLLPKAWPKRMTKAPGLEFNWSPQKEWVKQQKILRQTMWTCCGIVRTIAGLEKGLNTVQTILQQALKAKQKTKRTPVDLHNLIGQAQSSLLIIQSALARKESRGLHALLDYPVKRKSFQRHYTMRIH